MSREDLLSQLASHHKFDLCRQPTALAQQLYEADTKFLPLEEQFDIFVSLLKQANANSELPHQIETTLNIFADVDIQSADLTGDGRDEWLVTLRLDENNSYYAGNRQAIFIVQQGDIIYQSSESARLSQTYRDSRFEKVVADFTGDGISDLMLMAQIGTRSYLDFITTHDGELRSAIEVSADMQKNLQYQTLDYRQPQLSRSGDFVLVNNRIHGTTCTALNHTIAFKWEEDALRPHNLAVHSTGLRSDTFHAALLAYQQGDLDTAKALFYRVVSEKTLHADFPDAPCTYLTNMVDFSAFRLLLIAKLEQDNATAAHWHNWLTQVDKRYPTLPDVQAAADQLLKANNPENACASLTRDLEKAVPNINDRIMFDDAVDLVDLCQLPSEPSELPYTFAALNPSLATPQHTPIPYLSPTPTATYDPDSWPTQWPTPTSTPTPEPVDYGREIVDMEPGKLAQWIVEQRIAGKTVSYVQAALQAHIATKPPVDIGWGREPMNPFANIRELDIVGDGAAEWIVTIGKGHYYTDIATLFVIDRESIIMQRPTNIRSVRTEDFTGDGRDDLWFTRVEIGNCGTQSSHTIISGHHGKLETIFESDGRGCGGDYVVERTYDGAADLERIATAGSTLGTGMWCTSGTVSIRVYAWDEQTMNGGFAYRPLRWQSLEGYFMAAYNHYYVQPSVAADLYARLIKQKQTATDGRSGCSYDFMDKFAAVRLVILYKLFDDDIRAKQWQQWLHDNHPDDTFTDIADRLIDAPADNLAAVCDEIDTIYFAEPSNYMGDQIYPHHVCAIPNMLSHKTQR